MSSMLSKILIVDDNTDSRVFLATLLRLKGYIVNTATDGKDGLEHIRVDLPDLIITDLNMPHLDGVEMLKALREMPDFRRVPIVAISAYGSGRLSEAAKVGADYTMRKPLTCDVLLETISRLVN